MSLPQSSPGEVHHEAPRSGPNLLRSAIWVAIGALILAAIVCVIWVLIGPENDIIGRAFLTILLLAAFAGVAILDAHLAARREPWFALTSMVVWVVILLDGAFLIWMPTRDSYGFDGFARFFSFAIIVVVLQLALLHLRLYVAAYRRHVTGFTSAITWVTVALVAILAIMLVLPLTFHEFIDFRDLYWRFVVAVTILAAVGTALIPLVNALFAPKKQRVVPPAAAQGYAPQAQPWPTFVDGVTPLPVLPDGSPDWNAYYTGYPTYPAAPAQGWPQPPAPQTPNQGDPSSAPPPGAQPPPPAPQQVGPPAQQPPTTPPSGPPAPGYQGYPPPAPGYQGYPPPAPGYQGYPPPPPPPR